MEILDLEPEVPVSEVWQWLTDLLVSYDGTEQRISLRGGAPRYSMNLKLLTTDIKSLNETWHKLIASRGKLLVPEYQYATATTQLSPGAAARVYYTPSKTDIRLAEKFHILGYGVVEVLSLQVDGATLTANLTTPIPAGTTIAPIHEMIVSNPPSKKDAFVNYVSDFSISGTFNKRRSTLTRPGVTTTLTLWNARPVLDVRPSINEVSESVIEDDIIIDNSISAITLINKWDEAKLKSSKSFLVYRNSQEPCETEASRSLDYWREFLQYCRGSAKKFWLPTYRDDLVLINQPADSASSIITEGFSYGQKLFTAKFTYLYLEIATSGGTHRCTITGVGSSGSNTEVFFTPALPAGWSDLSRISFLVPARLDGDSVQWEHFPLHSVLNVDFRTIPSVADSLVFAPNRQTLPIWSRDVGTGFSTTFTGGGYLRNRGQSTGHGSLGQYIGWVRTLGEGTHTLTMVCVSGTSTGKMELSIDGTPVGTIDTYSAAPSLQTKLSVSFPVTTAGEKNITLTSVTANGASSSNIIQISDVWITSPSYFSLNAAPLPIQNVVDIPPSSWSLASVTPTLVFPTADAGEKIEVNGLGDYLEYEVFLPVGVYRFEAGLSSGVDFAKIQLYVNGVTNGVEVDRYTASPVVPQTVDFSGSFTVSGSSLVTLRLTVSGRNASNTTGYKLSASWLSVVKTADSTGVMGTVGQTAFDLYPWRSTNLVGWGQTVSGAHLTNMYYTPDTTDGRYLEWLVSDLVPGTYRALCMCATGSGVRSATLKHNGVDLVTWDLSGSVLQNVLLEQEFTISEIVSGAFRLTKNGVLSGVRFQYVRVERIS